MPIRNGLVSIDHAAQQYGIPHQALWKLLHDQAVEIHRVRWDGRSVSAVAYADLLRVRRAQSATTPVKAAPRRTPKADVALGSPRLDDGEKPLWSQIRDVQVESSKLETQIQTLEGELEKTRGERDRSKEELLRTQAELAEARRLLAETEGHLGEMDSTREKLEVLADRVEKLEGQLDASRSDLEQSRTRVQGLEKNAHDADRIRQQLDELRSRSELEPGVPDREASDLRRRLADVTKERDKLREQLSAAREVETSLQNYSDRLERGLREARIQLDERRNRSA